MKSFDKCIRITVRIICHTIRVRKILKIVPMFAIKTLLKYPVKKLHKENLTGTLLLLMIQNYFTKTKKHYVTNATSRERVSTITS